MSLRENIEEVEARIQAAAQRAGRSRSEITMIAVTKKFPAAVIRDAYDLGLRVFGENYVQEFADKQPALTGLADAQFHLIGHLQSNKTRLAADLFGVIQTVDSGKLARRLNESARSLEVMIEVKLSEEDTKAGAPPDALAGLMDEIRACENLRLTGLMTMPPWSADPAQTRPYFRKLAALARLHGLPKLSMGMSHDLEAAIEEGATHVRVGTALFGGAAEAMNVGYFSPMPPAATGVADYSAALLPYLGTVRLNQSGDVNLYHIGNNGLHREIYERALAEPGVVVLHDAVLQHFFLGTLDETAYVEEFVYNYGEWSRGEAQELWRERARSGADARYFARPMLRRILATARAVIVHNPAAAALVKEHASDIAIFEIPHLFVPPELPDPVDILRLRKALGVGPRTLLVGTFGHQRETKRLTVLLRAFERAIARGAEACLLVSGEFVSAAFANTMEALLRQPYILRTGHLAEPDFWKHLAATDLSVNLRYPSAAESSGVAIRMMGIGKAVAFSNDAAIARFPDDTCLRVDCGPAEEDMLADYIVWLAKEPSAAAAIGRNAARHIAREHAPEKVAHAYRNALSKT